MIRQVAILLVAVVVVALPFVFRESAPAGDWRPGDPVLTIVSPHTEAIRYEFGQAFAAWHRARYGRPVKIDWLNIGGTTEISRYLLSEYIAAFRAWWRRDGRPWLPGMAEAITARTAPADQPIAAEAHRLFRATDDPAAFTARIDLFFGGGEYDHRRAFEQGLTVRPWPAGQEPAELLADIPAELGGEVWRTATLFGNAVSTFGICYNLDRLRDLGVSDPPQRWEDLTAPVYYRQIGLADPTKSGSIAKAFEMIIHQACAEAVHAAGYRDDEISRLEAASARPTDYEAAVAEGWRRGLQIIQCIGANARYFTDSASKVPIDVAAGDATAGMAIDFYARFQAQCTRAPDGRERMRFVTPPGGSSVSADPISLLRGAPQRAVAVRFIEFVLSREGQQLWFFAPGTPGGPRKYALRRLPVRREFYTHAALYRDWATEDLADPAVDPYRLAASFIYRPRWTAGHFNVHRDLIRAMCLDSAVELQAAWQAILANGGPARQPAAMARLQQLPERPEPLTWASAPGIAQRYHRLEYLREWTAWFRANYRAARQLVVEGGR